MCTRFLPRMTKAGLKWQKKYAALHELIQKFLKNAHAEIMHRVIIGHAGCLELAEELKKRALETGRVKDCIIQKIGPVIGAHTGSPMCAIVFMGEQE